MRLVTRAPPCRRMPVIRKWPVWELQGWLRCFILAVIGTEILALGTAALVTPVRSHDLEVFIILLACNAATTEFARSSGEPAGLVKGVHAVWELPLALLLPPFYGLLVPIPRLILAQWRVRSTLPYRRLFSASAVGLSYGAASLAFHALAPAVTGLTSSPQARLLTWFAAALACGLARSAVNKVLVMTAVKGADPATSIRVTLFSREPLFSDAAELAIAVMITYMVTGSPFLALLALPFVPLLHRSLRHAQLVDASRIDGKTGLLNATTWQREARLEITRATRTRTPAAVAILDIDHFKNVNDTHGHLIGDAVLAAIARALRALLRDYDIVGRFGGEEFVLMLPHTTAEEARQITERLREKISQLTVPVSSAPGDPGQLRVTISIGVAVLHTSRRDISDLLAAADHALYQAKQSGRNRVCVSAESST